MAAWRPVTAGESGASIEVSADGSAYRKTVPYAATAELMAERDRVAWLAGRGIGSPAVLEWSEDETGARLVTSTVPGVPASALSPGDARLAWPSLVGTIGALHEIPAGDCPFERRLPGMLALAHQVLQDDAVVVEFLRPEQRGRSYADQLADLEADLTRRLAQERADLVVCHGDACLPNLLVDPESLRCTGVVDLGRLGVADRHADLSLLLANAQDEVLTGRDGAWAASELVATYGVDLVDPDRLRYYLLLDPFTWRR